MRIDSGQPHWYSGVFQSGQVANFLERHLEHPGDVVTDESNFILTVADALRSGSLFGCTINRTSVPGRFAFQYSDFKL